MKDENARVHISLREGILEIQGNEDFVAKQLELLEPLVSRAFENMSPMERQARSSATEKESDTSTGFSSYENLYAEADGKIQILKSLPGGNNSSKSINAALLLGFAKSLQGQDSVPYSDVRDLCKAHACLDSSNFSSTMKSQKSAFIVSGSGSGQTIKLTVPGKKKAEELAKQLNE